MPIKVITNLGKFLFWFIGSLPRPTGVIGIQGLLVSWISPPSLDGSRLFVACWHH